ncbi:MULTISPECIES: TVP38/TMEM64 family protein [unclassified Enterococcus]|uniref:TVP38/TMEM64 family protein n=1 Tax=unclassified Enterococcus TaxID=2608891 RepID=UPI001A91B5F3|nr:MULTISPECIES: VTT domain-containing protein [unclassified Enterococcus]MBO0461222.1 TVP38/TMEM64 family protein [Enterococcus sp. DIV1298c]MBO1299712.1 TVP38/TMEM64 family protein [Enterococcus sp. DIV1271a]
MKKQHIRYTLIGIGLLLILFVGYHLYLQYRTDIHLLLDPQASRKEWMTEIRSHGVTAAIILVVLISLMCAVPGIPTSVIGVLVGLSYGPLLGTAINVSGNALGNILSIALMQHVSFVDHSKKENRWVKAIRRMKHPKIGVMIGYMVPVIPSSVVNFAATSLNLSIRELVLSILIGVVPSSLLYACGGEALFHGKHIKAILLVASVLVLTVLVIIIYRDRRKHAVK